MKNHLTEILHAIVARPSKRLFLANGPALARVSFADPHPWPRINIKLDGHTRISIGKADREQEYEMHYGDLCFLSACAPLRILADSGSSIALVLRHNYLRIVYAETDGDRAVMREYYHIYDTLRLATIHAFKALDSLCETETDPSPDIAGRLVQLILEMSEEDLLQSHDIFITRSQNLWLQLVDHVDDYCLGDLPREKLAAVFKVTPDYVSRLFQRYANCTYKEYVNHHRMEHAAQLLLSGKCSVDEAAWQSGFTNTAYFIKTFRLYHGMTPGYFRDNVTRGRHGRHVLNTKNQL